MENLAYSDRTKRSHILRNLSALQLLGLLLGVVMPLVSAMVYPTYMHMMESVSVEWSRLLEAPFVLSEVLVILWASRKGMDSTKIWLLLPNDVKVASLILLLGAFASSIFISAYPLKSLTISIITVVHLLFAFAVYYLLVLSNVKNFRPFVTFLGAGLITLAALTFARFAFPPLASTVPGGVIEWHAALPGFISVRHFGSWTGAVTAGFLATLLYYDDKDQLSSAHALYFLSAAMTVWSGTRAAIAAIAITALILVLIRRKLPSFRGMAIIAMLTGAAMTAAWLLLPYNDPNFRLFIPSDLGSVNTLTSGRNGLWAATFEKWSHSPLWGWGSGSMFWEVDLGWAHTQPHNAVLQFLISWGIVGAVGALWLLIRAILRTHMIAVRNESMQPMLAILYTLLLMSLVEGMLHYPRFIMLIIVAFTAILAYDNNSRKQAINADSTVG